MGGKNRVGHVGYECIKKKKGETALSDLLSFAKHSHTQLKGLTEFHHLSTASSEQFISWIKNKISRLVSLFILIVWLTFHKFKD